MLPQERKRLLEAEKAVERAIRDCNCREHVVEMLEAIVKEVEREREETGTTE